jgi:glycerol-3-phosphate dehydrogenase
VTAGSDDLPPKESMSTAERIARLYGATAARVLGLQAEHREMAEPLASGETVTVAEVVEAIRHEMALTLEDVVVRRTGLGAVGYPGDVLVAACGAIAQQELGWSAERLEDEIAGVRRFYDIAPAPPAP